MHSFSSHTVVRVFLACFILSTTTLASSAIPDHSECANSSASGQWSGCKINKSRDAVRVRATNFWLQFYAKLPARKQQNLRKAADRIVRERRQSLKQLIQADPETAYSLSLSPLDRLGLPDFVVEHMETRIHTKGDLVLTVTESIRPDPIQGSPNPQEPTQISDNPALLDINVDVPQYLAYSWSLRIGDDLRKAHVYGIHQEHQSKFNIPIHAIAIDDAVAVSDRPLYLYDKLEKSQLGFKPGEIVATSGDLPIRLPGIKAYPALERELIDNILRFGPLPATFNPNEWTTGKKRVLLFKVVFGEETEDPPYTDGDITMWLGGVQPFFLHNSKGAVSLDPLIISAPIRVRAADIYTSFSAVSTGQNILMNEALRAARAYGLDPDSYDRVIIFARQIFDDPMATAAIGGRTVMVTGFKERLDVTLTHELGHTFGFPHSNFLLPADFLDPTGPGEFREYGDEWDVMGSTDDPVIFPNLQRRHFNVFYKAIAGWLPDSAVTDAPVNGTYRLYAHDSVHALGRRAIYVDVGGGTVYWIGKRGQFPENLSMANGIEVRRVNNYTPAAFGPVELLDADWTGRAAGVCRDSQWCHSLQPGTRIQDPATRTLIQYVGSDEDIVGPYVDILIRRP